MMVATISTTGEELQQISVLSGQNHRSVLDEEEKTAQGFITWRYSADLLHKMNELHPQVIVKDNVKVVGYALVALKEARHFHPDLEMMIRQLDELSFRGKKLSLFRYYVMGQICVDKPYRGKGLVRLLYEKHRELLGRDYDFVVTEVSTSNIRSLRAHGRVGFETIHTYYDALDQWAVIVWDWKQPALPGD